MVAKKIAIDSETDYRGMFLTFWQMEHADTDHCAHWGCKFSGNRYELSDRGLCMLAPYRQIHQQLAIAQ